MSATHTTYLRFSINENVLSLRDLVGCLGIDKKDIHAMRLVNIGEDDWNTYEFDLDCLLTAKEIDAEFGGTYVIKNVYVNGIALEEYDYDDTESTQETVASDLLNDTVCEDEEDEEDEEEEDDEEDEDDMSEPETEPDSEAETDSESEESDESDESKESMEKTPEEFLASLQKKFPDITTDPPTEEQKAILEKIATFFRDEKIALGNYKTGSIKACTGYSPMKDGGILLYF